MKRAIIDTLLPTEIGVLGRRIDEISLINFNEAAMELDGELTDEIKDNLIIKRNQMVGHCISSINRLKKMIITISELPEGEAQEIIDTDIEELIMKDWKE